MLNQPHRYRIVLDYIEPWLDEQDESTLRQVYADLLVLEREGPSLGRPLVDRVKGSKLHHLKELRVTSCGSSVIRILFAFDPKRQAVLLLAGDKSQAESSRGKVERLVCDQRSQGGTNIPSPCKEARSRWNYMSIWSPAV